MGTGVTPSAEQFDDWYATMAQWPARDDIARRHLGLPAHVTSTGLLTWSALDEIEAALRLRPGRTLLDLACGRGGHGLELAHRTGARLLGVDFSAEAVRQARRYADGLGRTAEFSTGDLTATGLPDASVHAVMCVDSVQFAEPPEAALREIRRILVPGGRAVLTCWQSTDPADDRMPERLRRLDLHAGLAGAGFADVTVEDRPAWAAVERAMWQEGAAVDPGADPVLRAFRDEAVRVLGFGDLSRRVVATATAP